MVERLNEEQRSILSQSLEQLEFGGSNEAFVKGYLAALNGDPTEWVTLPNGYQFRLNITPDLDAMAQLPTPQSAILETHSPQMDDWASHHGITGRNIGTGEITELR